MPAQALSVACPGQGSAQHQCCQSPADGPGDAQQQQPRPCAAAAQGAAQCGGDVSRRNAGAAAPPSWAQQLPGSGPPTPEAACEAESVSGELRHRAAEQPGHAPGATAAAAAVCAADALSDDPAGDLLMLRRLQSFVHCVAGSPLVQSALLFLEHVGEHPSALPASQAAAGPAGRASAAGLEWTLSQLLALWLRAGYTHGGCRLPGCGFGVLCRRGSPACTAACRLLSAAVRCCPLALRPDLLSHTRLPFTHLPPSLYLPSLRSV